MVVGRQSQNYHFCIITQKFLDQIKLKKTQMVAHAEMNICAKKEFEQSGSHYISEFVPEFVPLYELNSLL